MLILLFLSAAVSLSRAGETLPSHLPPPQPSLGCEATLAETRVRSQFHRVASFQAAAPEVTASYDRDLGLLRFSRGSEQLNTAVASWRRYDGAIEITARSATGEHYYFTVFDEKNGLLYAEGERTSRRLIATLPLHDVQFDINPLPTGEDKTTPEMIKHLLAPLDVLRRARDIEAQDHVVRYSTCGHSGSILERIEDCARVNGFARTFRRLAGGDWLLVSHHQASGEQYWLELATGLVWGPPLAERYFAADAVAALAMLEPVTKTLPTLEQYEYAWRHGFRALHDLSQTTPRFFGVNQSGKPEGLFLTHSGDTSQKIWYTNPESVRGVLATPIHWPDKMATAPRVFPVQAPRASTTPVPERTRDYRLESYLRAIGGSIRFMQAVDEQTLVVLSHRSGELRLVSLNIDDGDFTELFKIPDGLGVFSVNPPSILLSLNLTAYQHLSPRPNTNLGAVVRLDLATKSVQPIGKVGLPRAYYERNPPPPTSVAESKTGEVAYIDGASVFTASPPDYTVVQDYKNFAAARTMPRQVAFFSVNGESKLAVIGHPQGLAIRERGQAEAYHLAFPELSFVSLAVLHDLPLAYALTARGENAYLTLLDLEHEDVLSTEPLENLDTSFAIVAATRNRVFVKDRLGEIRAFVVPPTALQTSPRLAAAASSSEFHRPFARVDDFFVREDGKLAVMNDVLGLGLLPLLKSGPVHPAYRFVSPGRERSYTPALAGDTQFVWMTLERKLIRIDTVNQTADIRNLESQPVYTVRLRPFGDGVAVLTNERYWQFRSPGTDLVYRVKDDVAQALHDELGPIQDFDLNSQQLVAVGERKIGVIRLDEFKLERILFDREAHAEVLGDAKRPARLRLAGDRVLVPTRRGTVLALNLNGGSAYELPAGAPVATSDGFASIALDLARRQILVSNGRTFTAVDVGGLNWNQIRFEHKELAQADVTRFRGAPYVIEERLPLTPRLIDEARVRLAPEIKIETMIAEPPSRSPWTQTWDLVRAWLVQEPRPK